MRILEKYETLKVINEDLEVCGYNHTGDYLNYLVRLDFQNEVNSIWFGSKRNLFNENNVSPTKLYINSKLEWSLKNELNAFSGMYIKTKFGRYTFDGKNIMAIVVFGEKFDRSSKNHYILKVIPLPYSLGKNISTEESIKFKKQICKSVTDIPYYTAEEQKIVNRIKNSSQKKQSGIDAYKKKVKTVILEDSRQPLAAFPKKSNKKIRHEEIKNREQISFFDVFGVRVFATPVVGDEWKGLDHDMKVVMVKYYNNCNDYGDLICSFTIDKSHPSHPEQKWCKYNISRFKKNAIS